MTDMRKGLKMWSITVPSERPIPFFLSHVPEHTWIKGILRYKVNYGSTICRHSSLIFTSLSKYLQPGANIITEFYRCMMWKLQPRRSVCVNSYETSIHVVEFTYDVLVDIQNKHNIVIREIIISIMRHHYLYWLHCFWLQFVMTPKTTFSTN